jgi:hypothetical protein
MAMEWSGCDGMVGSKLIADACGGYRDEESLGSDCADGPNGDTAVEVCGSDDAPTCIDCAGVANDNAGLLKLVAVMTLSVVWRVLVLPMAMPVLKGVKRMLSGILFGFVLASPTAALFY